MSLINLPNWMLGRKLTCLSFIECDFDDFLEILENSEIWKFWRREGWVGSSKLPIILNSDILIPYGSELCFGIVMPSISMKGATIGISMSFDRVSSEFVGDFSTKGKCRAVSTVFCDDWRSNDAYAHLIIRDCRHFDSERIVRVMKDGGRRLDFYQSGIISKYENPSNYLRRRFSDRLSRLNLNNVWNNVGVNIDKEVSDFEGRSGFAYAEQNGSTPIKDWGSVFGSVQVNQINS